VKKTEAGNTKFEQSYDKLKKIVERLEQGELPLEESLKLYEEGVKLVGLCTHKLDEVQRRIEVLTKDQKGELKAQPFETEEG